MAVTRLPRTQTNLEALAPVVKDLFSAIDQSKKLRGERLQVESVFKSLGSLDPNATPEERTAAITGGLQQVRSEARSENEGFLNRLISRLDPREPSFEGVTPIEKFVADQQLDLAFQGRGEERFGILPWYLRPDQKDTAAGRAALKKSLGGMSDIDELKFWQGVRNTAGGRFFQPGLEGAGQEPEDADLFDFAEQRMQEAKKRIEGAGQTSVEGTELDEAEARRLLNKAGGDKGKARKMARELGFIF